MTSIRLQPHRTASLAAWQIEPWQTRYGERSPEGLGERIPDFDYQIELGFGFRARIDPAVLAEETGLGSDAKVGIFALLDCAPANLRCSKVVPVNGPEDVEIWLHAEPGTLAREIELLRGLVLLEPGTISARRVATQKGSRLLEEPPLRVLLEGTWSRFPVEAVSFSAVGRAGGAWVLRSDYSELSDPFLWAVRLLVNVDHPAGRVALERGDTEKARLVRGALRADILRQFFAVLRADIRIEDDEGFPDGSVGSVAHSMATDLLGRDLRTILTMDPIELDELIQDRTAYLREEDT